MSNTSLYAVRDTGGVTAKVDIILGAYSQLRISGITRSPTPEDLETALCRLENMAAEWDTVGTSVGYNFEDEPDPNSNSGIIRGYRNAFETNLAVRLIPDFNKTVPASLMMQASQSLSNLCARAAMQRVRGVQYPDRQPTGSGNNIRVGRWARFYRKPMEAPQASTTRRMFICDEMDFREHFGSYLRDAEELASYSIVVDSGLVLVSDSLETPDVLYRLRATDPSGTSNGNVVQVTIVATTNTDRVETRRHYVELVPRD